jgi:hypothetical protein
MALSKAVTLLDWSRRKLRISVVMLMMPPMQECFVPLGQNHQWDFRTMLAVLRCEFLRERAGSATRQASIALPCPAVIVSARFMSQLISISHLSYLSDQHK